MPLTRDNWPTRDRIKDDLSARFSLPIPPSALEPWFAFARQALGMDLVLTGNAPLDEDAESIERTLDCLEVIDLPSTFAAMNGYRFILDQKNSSADALIWTDQTDTGQWRAEWVVIESIGADPIIADVSQPQIPILCDFHGRGRWSPQPMFDTLTDFIASLEVRSPQAQTFIPSPLYSVLISDFGPTPKRCLLALKRLPAYSDHSPAELMSLLDQLPLSLVEETVSEPLAKRIAQIFLHYGAKVEITTRND